MASKSLGTLTLDLVAKIGGFTAGMSEAERASKKSADQIKKNIESIGVAGYAVGTALGGFIKDGLTAAANVFPDLIDKAAQFQDIADKTGGSAAGFAGFAVSAKVAGVEMDTLANASVKLTKALTGVDDESKAAGAALSAIGLNIEDFKKLEPSKQIDAVAQALGNFEEGAGKTAVAMDLFGKSGAEVIKFLKDYQENGGAVNILTEEQIKRADEYADAQARARAQLELYASAAATEALPAITALTGVAKDLIKEMLGVGNEAGNLAANNGVRTFAENAVEALGFIIDAAQGVKVVFSRLGEFIGATGAGIAAVMRGDLQGLKAIQQSYDESLSKSQFNSVQERIKGAIQAQKELNKLAAQENRGFKPQGNVLNYQGAMKKAGGGGKKDNSAAQEAKAQLASDLADIKNANRELVDSYANQEKILEALRSAGLKDESAYYAEKNDLLQKNIDANVKAQQEIIARLQAESLTGKDAIDNAKKIAEAQSQLNKVQADGATQAKILGIQQEASLRKQASALLAARQAAQDYFDTVNEGYASTLAGIGKGAKDRDFNAALQQISEKYQQQRQTLANQRAQAELLSGGVLSPEAAKRFDDQLAIINEFQSKSLSSYQKYYEQLDAAQKDWANGATEALTNYANEAQNVAKMTEEVFSKAFSGLEDSLVDFVTTGKANFKDLVKSILADVNRLLIKNLITGPLANSLSGAISGVGGSGFAGILSLFGGSSGGGADAIGDLISKYGFASGGYTGNGGVNEPAGIVHKGEWVLDAQTTRAIGVNNLKSGNFGGQTVNFAIHGNIDRRTEEQIAQKTRQAQLNAAARFR